MYIYLVGNSPRDKFALVNKKCPADQDKLDRRGGGEKELYNSTIAGGLL